MPVDVALDGDGVTADSLRDGGVASATRGSLPVVDGAVLEEGKGVVSAGVDTAVEVLGATVGAEEVVERSAVGVAEATVGVAEAVDDAGLAAGCAAGAAATEDVLGAGAAEVVGVTVLVLLVEAGVVEATLGAGAELCLGALLELAAGAAATAGAGAVTLEETGAGAGAVTEGEGAGAGVGATVTTALG